MWDSIYLSIYIYYTCVSNGIHQVKPNPTDVAGILPAPRFEVLKVPTRTEVLAFYFTKKIQRKIRRNHHFMWWKMRFFCYNCGISVVFFYNNNDRPASTRPQGQLLSFPPRAMVPQRTARRRDFVSGGNRWTKQFQWSTEWLFLRMVNQWLLPQIR